MDFEQPELTGVAKCELNTWEWGKASTLQRYGKPQALDQLEEWMKEKPIPYISNDKFSQEGIFDY